MRIVFMATPEFAVPSLDKLIHSRHEVIAAVCQPDREKDKKGNIIFPPIKKRALESNLPIYQFTTIKTEGAAVLSALKPDIIVTAAYGQILTQEILDIPKHGVINVHASLLPKYRGSSPIQHAILGGETETGITIMQTALGLDTGDIISTAKTAIKKGETAGELSTRLAEIGANLLMETLAEIESGKATKTPQNDSQATKCPMIKKTDGLIDWQQPAEKITAKIQAMNPWPLAHSYITGKRISIFKAEPYKTPTQQTTPNTLQTQQTNANTAPTNSEKKYATGEVIPSSNEFLVSAGQNTILKIIEAQAEGKNKMNATELLKGLRIPQSGRFTNER